jgi:CspA family cold shock protein
MKKNGASQSTGTVKWFSDKRGYGFISANGGPEVFVHQTAIIRDGFRTLHKGDTVQFDLVDSPKGPLAENVQLI